MLIFHISETDDYTDPQTGLPLLSGLSALSLQTDLPLLLAWSSTDLRVDLSLLSDEQLTVC
jgi:hypothetical protein